MACVLVTGFWACNVEGPETTTETTTGTSTSKSTRTDTSNDSTSDEASSSASETITSASTSSPESESSSLATNSTSTNQPTSTNSTGNEIGQIWRDDFSGTGALTGYTVNNPSAVPSVTQINGRYRALIDNNDDNRTLHFNQDQGRLDARALDFPFEVIARNIGIGSVEDSQNPPSADSNPFLFAGLQIHVEALNERNSSHVVVGHRGSTHFTIEGKNTVNGSSRVDDAGANIVPAGRADLRIVGTSDRGLVVYWQRPNPDPTNRPDQWTMYRGHGRLPGSTPSYGARVYVGLITYAYQLNGLPFVGTADSFESRAAGLD